MYILSDRLQQSVILEYITNTHKLINQWNYDTNLGKCMILKPYFITELKLGWDFVHVVILFYLIRFNLSKHTMYTYLALAKKFTSLDNKIVENHKLCS